MPILEVFTFGGGQYLLAVFNAVAAWTGSGGYASMIRVAMVLGLILATMVMAFNLNWRAWINWFLTATLIYLGLMVPKVELVVIDRVQSTLPIGSVANVPLGLGLLASFTSQLGDWLTTSSEVVFGMPDDLRYSSNGMIYGARLYQATQHLRIRDPEFATNLDEHFRQCVYYDVLLGLKSLDVLASTPDIWTAIGPGSPARSQKFLTRQPDDTVTSDIITCQAAYTAMSTDWATMIDTLAGPFAHNLYPRMTEALAKSKLLTELPISYDWLTGVSADAVDIFRQNLAMNAMEQAMYSMAGSTGSAALDVYATTRMQTQTRNTYAMIGENAMKWVPLLHVVLTVLFYAMFPLVFPLFLFPYGGVSALRGYAYGFFYLAAWGPLFEGLNMILMWKARDEGLAAAGGPGGVTLATFSGMQEITSDVGILAGYLIASVPFLAAGIAKGAMAISGQATSFLAPSQAAASQAGIEASTGSFSIGTTSFDTHASNNRQVSQWTAQPQYLDGYAQQATVGPDGSLTTRFGSSTVVDQNPAISRLSFTPQLSQELQSSFQKSATEYKARGYSLSNSASEAFASAFSRFQDFRRTVSQGDTLDASYGRSDASTIRNTFGMMDQAADTISRRYGFSREQSEKIVTDLARRLSGGVGINLSVPLGGGGQGGSVSPLSVSARGNSDISRTKSDIDSTVRSNSTQLDDARQFLTQLSESQDWGRNFEAFQKAAISSSRSDIASSASGMTASFDQSNTLARQAVESFERAQRFEDAASLRDSSGVSITDNLSQEFVEFVFREQSKMPGGIGGFAWNPTRGLPRTQQEIAEKDFFVDAFYREKAANIAAGVEGRLVRPSPAGIIAPSVNTQAGLNKIDAEGRARVPSLPEGGTAVPLVGPEDLRRENATIERDVDIRSGLGHARVEGRRAAASDDAGAIDASDETQLMSPANPPAIAIRVVEVAPRQ